MEWDRATYTVEELTDKRYLLLFQLALLLPNTGPHSFGSQAFLPQQPMPQIVPLSVKSLRCSFGDVDIALFSAGGSISKKFAHIASDAGATVSWSLRHHFIFGRPNAVVAVIAVVALL